MPPLMSNAMAYDLTPTRKVGGAKEIGEECKRILAQREMRANINRLNQNRGTGDQYSFDRCPRRWSTAAALAEVARTLWTELDGAYPRTGVLG